MFKTSGTTVEIEQNGKKIVAIIIGKVSYQQ